MEVIKAKLSPLNISRLHATYVTTILSVILQTGLYTGPECAVKLPFRADRLLPLVTVCTSGPSKARLAGSAPEPEPGGDLVGPPPRLGGPPPPGTEETRRG